MASAGAPVAFKTVAGPSIKLLQHRASNAAKHQKRVDERVALRVLRRPLLGKHVYAYNHILTNQVVYSLTNVLEAKTVMPQLLFHGKKSVPAAVRRDLWLPYFRAHFPTTKHGLTAYRQLRELSLIRQLAPPLSIVEKTHRYHADRTKKRRARALMNQKASSAADLAFVLSLQGEVKPSKSKPLKVQPDNQRKHSRRELRNMRDRKKVYDYLENQYKETAIKTAQPIVTFSPDVMAQINQQLEATLAAEDEAKPEEKASDQEENVSDTKVQVYWADLADALVGAKSDRWPSVEHSLLDSREKVGRHRNVHTMGIGESGLMAEEADEPVVEDASPSAKPFTSRIADTLMFWKRS